MLLNVLAQFTLAPIRMTRENAHCKGKVDNDDVGYLTFSVFLHSLLFWSNVCMCCAPSTWCQRAWTERISSIICKYLPAFHLTFFGAFIFSLTISLPLFSFLNVCRCFCACSSMYVDAFIYTLCAYLRSHPKSQPKHTHFLDVNCSHITQSIQNVNGCTSSNQSTRRTYKQP